MQKLPVEVALLKIMSKHPRSENVVELLDYFQTCDFFVFVLERPVPCMDLCNFCYINKGRLSEAVARKIISQVVKASVDCVDRGVLHRDIKEQNILINPDTLEVMMIDFGCGCLLKDDPYKDPAVTPVYWPPEWFISQQYLGVPAAVWSLGVVLFSLVCAYLPFASGQKIVEGYLRFQPHLSEDCCDLINLCLKRNPEDRPSLREILDHRWFMEELQETV